MQIILWFIATKFLRPDKEEKLYRYMVWLEIFNLLVNMLSDELAWSLESKKEKKLEIIKLRPIRVMFCLSIVHKL